MYCYRIFLTGCICVLPFPLVMTFLAFSILPIRVLMQFVVLVKLCSVNNQTMKNCLVEVLDIQKHEVILANTDIITQFVELICLKKPYLTFNIRMNIDYIFRIKLDEWFSPVYIS